MRKALIILSIFCWSFFSAQNPYQKMLLTDTVVWQHFDCFIPVLGAKTAALAGAISFAALDTTSIGGLKYRKVYDLNTYGISYSFKSLEGYMREDTVARKVYFKLPNASEQLLYDFSKNVGDSTYFTFNFAPSFNGFYRVDSIITKNIRCGPRKHFYYRKHLNNNNPGTEYMEHIESIGCSYHILYPFNYLQTGCQLSWINLPSCKWPDWAMGLSCKHNDLKKQFQNCAFSLAQLNNCINKVDSCNFHNYCSNIRRFSSGAEISVFPNPVNEKLIIDLSDHPETMTIRISNSVGKTLLEKTVTFKGELPLDMRTFENGIYFIHLQSDKGYSVKQFSVMR